MKVQNVEVSDTTGDDKKYAAREIKIVAAFIEANEKNIYYRNNYNS
jgi:hypothetical protein